MLNVHQIFHGIRNRQQILGLFSFVTRPVRYVQCNCKIMYWLSLLFRRVSLWDATKRDKLHRQKKNLWYSLKISMYYCFWNLFTIMWHIQICLMLSSWTQDFIQVIVPPHLTLLSVLWGYCNAEEEGGEEEEKEEANEKKNDILIE